MSVRQLSIFVENKEAGLAQITGILAQNQIDIRALSIADTMDYGILRLIVDQPEKAAEVLRDQQCAVTMTEVLAIQMPDQPGSLHSVVKMLSDEHISIEYMYAFLGKNPKQAYLIVRAREAEKAAKVLRDHQQIELGEADIC